MAFAKFRCLFLEEPSSFAPPAENFDAIGHSRLHAGHTISSSACTTTCCWSTACPNKAQLSTIWPCHPARPMAAPAKPLSCLCTALAGQMQQPLVRHLAAPVQKHQLAAALAEPVHLSRLVRMLLLLLLQMQQQRACRVPPLCRPALPCACARARSTGAVSEQHASMWCMQCMGACL